MHVIGVGPKEPKFVMADGTSMDFEPGYPSLDTVDAVLDQLDGILKTNPMEETSGR